MLQKPNNYVLLILWLFLEPSISIFGQSNEGTEFWFSFLEHRDRGNNRMCMISSKYNTSGYIELPSIGWRQSFNILANTVYTVRVPKESEIIGSEIISNTGVKVVTDLPSSVYIHQFNEFRSDAALVLPVNSLGNQYYAITYKGYENQDDHYPSEFAIVAIENNTSIEVRVACNTKSGRLKGDLLQIVLNEGQSYQIQAARVTDDLTGSYLKSNKKIAVFSGNRWTQIPNGCGNRDNTLEQMYPIEVWGKEFVTVPAKNVTQDIFRVIASEDNTDITINVNSGTPILPFKLMKGEWREFSLNAVASYIQATNPIQIAQFLVGGECNGHNQIGDPSMVLLNSIEQYRDTVTIFNSTFQNITENYINIITQTKDTSDLLVDNLTISQLGYQFQTIGPNNEFSYVQLDVWSGPHTLISNGCGLIAIAYGYGFAESYAYGGGANFRPINALQLPDGACLGDTMIFKTGLPEKRYELMWNLGDGTQSNLYELKHKYLQQGSYNVELIIHDLCRNKIDTLRKIILISLRRGLVANGDGSFCENDSALLLANDIPGCNYQWIGPNQFKSNEQNPILKQLKTEDSGTYTVSSNYFGCLSYPEDIEIIVHKNPIPSLGRDTFFCFDKGQMIISTEQFDTYMWQDGSQVNTFKVQREGIYSVQVSNSFGCLGSDTIVIEDKCPLSFFVPNVFSPNGDHINDYFIPKVYYGETVLLEIYDRWGSQLFKSSNYSEGWDGSYNGENVNPGVYIYVLTIKGYNEKGELINKVISGDLTLLR